MHVAVTDGSFFFPLFFLKVTVKIHNEEMLHLQFIYVMQTDASAGLVLAANHTQP